MPGTQERPASQNAWTIRSAQPDDAPFLERLAERLTIGIPPWRDATAMVAAARGWLLVDLERAGGADAAMYLAETDDASPIGAVSVCRSKHFTGALEAYIGELAVIAAWEGRGVASALLAEAETWARLAGLPFITLATGAANDRALAFYARHGYLNEDVRLAKPLDR